MAAEEKRPEPIVEPTPARKEKVPDWEREHTLTPGEVKPIHRAFSRILGRFAKPLDDEEMSALNEFGARFWSRWIRTSWAASGLAYAATVTDVTLERVGDEFLKPGTKRSNGTPGPIVEPKPPTGTAPVTEPLDDGAAELGRS
jgi:hypothetical protein